MVVTVKKLQWSSSIQTLSLNTRSTLQNEIDHLRLPSHSCPVDRLVGTIVTRTNPLGMFIQQLGQLFKIMLADRLSKRLACMGWHIGSMNPSREYLLHFAIATILRDL